MKRAYSEGKAVRARIRILDRELQGTLAGIANQPEPSGWWSGNIKEYATTVRIDGNPDGLRPGMTAECEILVDHLKDVMYNKFGSLPGLIRMSTAIVLDERSFPLTSRFKSDEKPRD